MSPTRNGEGYPRGLHGEGIPLSARIVPLCDTYDALVNKRPYKEAFSHEEAVGIIKAERGSSFDPEIVDLFVENQQEFRKIADHIADEQQPGGRPPRRRLRDA